MIISYLLSIIKESGYKNVVVRTDFFIDSVRKSFCIKHYLCSFNESSSNSDTIPMLDMLCL